MGPSVEDLLKSKGVGSTTTGQVTFLPDPEPPDVWATIVSVDERGRATGDLRGSLPVKVLRGRAPYR